MFKKWLLPAQKPIAVQAVEAAPAKPLVAGTEPGWLRVCNAPDLLQCVKADKALAEIWRQSRQSDEVWQRDLLPAIHRYAEFVQLMPASEAHHHAHAGGLLSHTIEMLLVSMTRRNAYLLPEGSPIEIIDAQRDQWTYVVFFAALLHDIAKPMTDLRIQWRCDGMADSVRWMPAGGSLHQIMDQRKEGEYLVDFAPKSQRDYTAHTRLAQTLLPRIAPASALSFLSRYPQALVVLENYLCGQDKESLVAKIVKSADSLSTKRALTNGSKARFASAKAVPLIDLMMQAISSMLQAGTVLPLNRNGAAGWVFEGAVWFVAKRLADSVREWVKANEPEEAIPGQAKNDRLFDTWQDYGVIDLNPVTGQAIWYVEVHGSEGEQGGYVHEFSMLRFPLPKLFQSESQYPAAMRGHLVLKDKRKAGADHEEQE
ncbi:MAG: MobH family relaxase, partial [Acinetobacter sp.]